MKVIYLHQYFTTPEMSGGTRSYEMARRMVAAGHEVHMVTSYREMNTPEKSWFKTEESGIHVHWYPVPYSNNMSFLQRIKAFFDFAMAARKKAVKLGGDIIFASSTPLTIALPAVPASRKNKIPLVFEVRDLWPEMPIAVGALQNPLLKFAAHKLELWAYRNSQAVVALSPGMKEGVVRTGFPAEKVAVIPNGCDNVEFQFDASAAVRFRKERNWLGSSPLFVYAGTFGKVNGVDYIIDVAEQLLKIESEIKILLVGSGAEREKTIQMAKKKKVYEKNVFIEGAMPKSEIPGLLSAATMASNLVIDLPEARANSANKFFDTLASGTPIFINHGGWMHELVKSTGCGLAMWQKSPADVAVELDSKMQDPQWLEKAGRAARQLAEENFDREKLADELIRVLQAVKNKCPERAAYISPGCY
ncbi:glycosyltransferase family 4 protein [uncultured Halomonas sp.]|uniref:glycosyltransferase family 4 protein n=1 Tax=uncultured Halomonas sp. TaxID=173971 RepID=UPI0026371164|nr:glycosyltransferase family 4 protein [uncultured Halomonas sp.]